MSGGKRKVTEDTNKRAKKTTTRKVNAIFAMVIIYLLNYRGMICWMQRKRRTNAGRKLKHAR